MHFEEHLLLGWHLSQFSGLSRRGRVAVTLCGVLPDVDAVSIVAGEAAFYRWHHTATHSLLFVALVAAGAAVLGRQRWRAGVFCALAVASHLVADMLGTRWGVGVFWPFTDAGLLIPGGWWLGAWQNRAVLVGLVVLAAPSIIAFGHSPLELLNPALDPFLTSWLVPSRRPGGTCGSGCGRTAMGLCASCGAGLCARCVAIGARLAPLCADCRRR